MMYRTVNPVSQPRGMGTRVYFWMGGYESPHGYPWAHKDFPDLRTARDFADRVEPFCHHVVLSDPLSQHPSARLADWHP